MRPVIGISSANKIGSSSVSTKSNIITAAAPRAKASSAPRNVKSNAGSKSASLSWTKGSDGGPTLTSQTVTDYSRTKKIGRGKMPGSATSVKITGLSAGKAYAFDDHFHEQNWQQRRLC
ncbi:fibronectin type III domain-containing protein [Arthrobacter sp. H14]|uniref:fibronectin type III domain-containing protein n=1 Tax=Arthrobacter sp. H14 TaxID=1312959 RepID=UPI0004787D2D